MSRLSIKNNYPRSTPFWLLRPFMITALRLRFKTCLWCRMASRELRLDALYSFPDVPINCSEGKMRLCTISPNFTDSWALASSRHVTMTNTSLMFSVCSEVLTVRCPESDWELWAWVTAWPERGHIARCQYRGTQGGRKRREGEGGMPCVLVARTKIWCDHMWAPLNCMFYIIRKQRSVFVCWWNSNVVLITGIESLWSNVCSMFRM